MLTHSSDILQRFGVGWEQVDLEKTDKTFSSNFTNTVNNLKVVSNKLMKVLADYGRFLKPSILSNADPVQVERDPGG